MSVKKRIAIVAAVIAVLLLLTFLLPANNPTISVTITSANLRFLYYGSTVDYLLLVSNVLSNHTLRAKGSDTIQFTDAIVIRNNGSSSHKITSVSVLTNRFSIVSNGSLPALPFDLTAGGVLNFTLVIRYDGESNLTGPLDVRISTE